MTTYYTMPLSDHLEETPEGNLICRDVPIARTGWQTYKVSELPKKAADSVGIDVSDPNADIKLYRDASDVFHPDALASFEGKTVTDQHPPDFVEPRNFSEYAMGHVQNVRQGEEPLDSGEYPMLADLHITSEPLLSKVRNKIVREVSCGYDYSLRREGDKVLQADITGNHVAVVPKGRAGPEARIHDSATSTTTQVTATKEKKPVSDKRRHLLGRILKAFAADAEPEEVAEAMEAMNHKPADDTSTTNNPEAGSVTDAAARDAADRKRAHDALDRVLDKKRGMHDAGEMCPNCDTAPCVCAGDAASDTDINELRGLLDQFFTEEQGEEEHAEDEAEGDPGPGAEAEPGGEEEEVNGGDDHRARAADSAAGAKAVLKVLRPFVARTNDKAVKSAFNAALASVNTHSRPTRSAGYSAFAGSARDRAAAGPRHRANNPQARAADSATVAVDRNAKLQAAYNAALKEGK